MRKVGPLLMHGREPFNLRTVMVIHNALLVLVNLYIVIISMPYLRVGLTCKDLTTLDPKELEVLLMVFYFYYITKYIDLLDTIFFVLRKKCRNLSELHLFHHSLMPIG